MKSKIIIAAAILTLGCIGTIQAFSALEKEQPQEIRGIIVDEHDAAWCETQQHLWLKQAEANPKDEHAWQQAFEAARYADMFSEQYGRTERKSAILNQMAKHIPNSFTYNLCMYMTEIAEPDGNPNIYAEKALQLMPQNIARKDAEMLISYLWMNGVVVTDSYPSPIAANGKPDSNPSQDKKRQQFNSLVRTLYTTNAYPSYLLRYTYNSLQGMDENALYFVNGDVPSYTSLILQEGAGVHQDKIIIPVSFLYVETYRKALCAHLGIPDFEITKDYDSMDIYFQDILEHIILKSNRPAYFFPSGSYPETTDFKRKLYNEGLVFRYSTRRYDNMAIAKRNVEKRYSLHYLVEPQFTHEDYWQGSERGQLNYMVMLAPVVKSYKQEGDTLRANQLARYLSAAVMQTSLPSEEKKKYFNLLDDKKK